MEQLLLSMVKINEKAMRLAAPARTAMRRSVTSAHKSDKPVPQPLSRLAGRVAIQSPIIIENPVQTPYTPRSRHAPNPSATPDSFKSPAISKAIRPNTKAPKRAYAKPWNEKAQITGGVELPALAERHAESKTADVKSMKKPARPTTKPVVSIIKKSVYNKRNTGTAQAKILTVANIASPVMVEKEEAATVAAAIAKAPISTAVPELEERVSVPENNDEDDLEIKEENEKERKTTLLKTPAPAAIECIPTAAPESYEGIVMKVPAVNMPTAALESADDVLSNVEEKAETANNFLTSFEIKMAAMKKDIVVALDLPEKIKEEDNEDAKQEAKIYKTKYRFQLEEDDIEASLLFEYDAVEPSFIFSLPEDVAWEGNYTETETREAQVAPVDHRLNEDYLRECLSLDNPLIFNRKPSRIPGPSEPIPDKPRKHVTKVKLETFKMISGGWWVPTNKSLDEDTLEFLPFAIMKPHTSGEGPVVDHWDVSHNQRQVEPNMAPPDEVFPHWDHWDWSYRERELGADPALPQPICAHEEPGWSPAPDPESELPEIVLTPATRTPSPSSKPAASPTSIPSSLLVVKRLRFGDDQVRLLIRSDEEWADMRPAPAKKCPVTERASGKKHMFKAVVSCTGRSRRETLGDNFIDRYKAVRRYGDMVRADGEPDYPHEPYGTEDWKVGTDHPGQFITVDDVFSPIVIAKKMYWQNGKFEPLHRHGWLNVEISDVLPPSAPRAEHVEKRKSKQQARFGRTAQSKEAVKSSKTVQKNSALLRNLRFLEP